MTNPFMTKHNWAYMTKSQFFFIVVLCILMNSVSGFAYSTPEDCQYRLTQLDNLQFSNQYQKKYAECWFSVHPINAYVDLVYRDYLITSQGLLFVFNSFGHGSDSKTTGARNYYFFPRETFKGDIELAQDKVSIRVNSKLTLQFETKNLYLLNTENITFKNYRAINPKNAGGVEVLRYNGVYLDTGFMMGESPTSVPTLKSMFKNQFGQKCSVQNQLIFDYKDGEAILINEDALHRIVANQCPKFKWID